MYALLPLSCFIQIDVFMSDYCEVSTLPLHLTYFMYMHGFSDTVLFKIFAIFLLLGFFTLRVVTASCDEYAASFQISAYGCGDGT